MEWLKEIDDVGKVLCDDRQDRNRSGTNVWIQATQDLALRYHAKIFERSNLK